MPKIGTKMGKIRSIGDLRHYVARKDYISFDLFDTLIKRRFLNVNEVHDTVSAYVLAQLGQMHERNPSDFTMLRYRMCTALKASGSEAIQEPEIGLIWDRILAPHVPEADKRASLVERIVGFELSLELQNLGLIDGALELLSRLRSEKKTLIAISDMYFSFDHMKQIMAKLGIFGLFDHVFISADVGLTKQTSDLFLHVLENLDIRPHDILHVGDNPTSDIDMATRLGIVAVQVEQHHLLQLERPQFGKRKRVEEDIADVVKSHLLSVLLDAHNRKAEHIYFMARDGLAIHSFFERWESNFRDAYLPSPGHSEMYLNRVLTIWANVDFSVDWLPHAVGIAFWLKEGTATAAELSALFGIAEVPAELGDEKLTSIHDTFRAAHAYREAGLEEAIKAAILEQRLNVERYLDGIGFFDCSSVVISDVGYSGTVARALNGLLMQRCAEGSPYLPPAMVLHLIITHHNYEVNRPFALPFCEFTNRIPFPVSILPESLSGSYAWLEYFFKHPTLLPIVRFVQQEGKLIPDLREHPEPDTAFPSQRLLEFTESRDEDIILLWMAATNNFEQLTSPLIERFSNPDADTIMQMRDPVYELDPIAGTTRSLILEVPNGPAEVIAEAARKGDYWIAGSLAVSNAESESDRAAVPPQPPMRQKRKGLLRWIRSRAVSFSVATMKRGFEPDFYGSFYPDLRIFRSESELWHHYVNHGRRERRLTSRDALRAQLLAEFGPLPDGFDWGIYLHLNPDLEPVADTPERALHHYMRSGRFEGRSCKLSFDEICKEFELIRSAGALALSAEELTRIDRGESTMRFFLQRHLLNAGPWINDLDLADFRALHRPWAGDVKNKAEAIVAICEKGLGRMPSLSLRVPFDADYYRSHAPELAKLENTELYRHYLNLGYRKGFEPSEQAALQRIWGREDFPESFDWKAWQKETGKQGANFSRCDILKGFIDAPGIEKASFVKGDGGAQFLEFLGSRAWLRHGRVDEARVFFNAAIWAGGNAGWLQHLLGDLEAEAGNVDQALQHYRKGQGHSTPNRWSYIKAADLLLRHGDYGTALANLEAGRSAWQETAPWRRLYERAMHQRSNACVKHIVARPGGAAELQEADSFAADIASRIPAAAHFDGNANGVIVFTGRALTTNSDLTQQRDVTVRHLRDIDRFDYLGALLQHDEVIFHEVPFTYEVLRAILTARALGKRTTLWMGDLRRWKNHDLDQSIWGDTGEQVSWLRSAAVWELALVGRYCDNVVTTLAGCSRAIALLAPQTHVQEYVRLYSNVRGNRADRCTVLVLAADAGNEDLKHLAGAIAGAARKDSRLKFLVDGSIARRRELRDLTTRLAVIDDNSTLSLLAATIATADLVVQSVPHDLLEPYAAWKEAQAAGVPAIVIRQARSKENAVRSDVESSLVRNDVPLFEGNLIGAITECFASNSPAYPSKKAVVPFTRGVGGRVPPRTKRILFVNVWFAPQAIGGATRVLTDNVDYILDHHPDEFELAAFASDEFNDRCGEFTLDAYRNLPVFRIATPQEANIYWRPDSAMAAARFASVIDSFKPDLVHIHCLQRLGGTIADVCQDRGVPYIVTLHDAWWLSDFPFLSDTFGSPAVARQDYYDQPRLETLDPMLSATRAQSLRQTLLGAERRFAVSESFRTIYERCGIPCEVIGNGTSRIQQQKRARNSRVRLCHIGGLERHKGAYLIEAALKTHEFTNLELTLIDLARTTGHDTRTVWGTTPVTITGKMSSDELAALYACSNILLAPSTCEESFGLASREALAHGLWVIAGDRGAMAEPIVQGKNGYVISVDDASDLARVLRHIDHNADRYKESPEEYDIRRTADDQSRDLIDLYRSILHGKEARHQDHSDGWFTSYPQAPIVLSTSPESAI